jgi:hypothetical protein
MGEIKGVGFDGGESRLRLGRREELIAHETVVFTPNRRASIGEDTSGSRLSAESSRSAHVREVSTTRTAEYEREPFRSSNTGLDGSARGSPLADRLRSAPVQEIAVSKASASPVRVTPGEHENADDASSNHSVNDFNSTSNQLGSDRKGKHRTLIHMKISPAPGL